MSTQVVNPIAIVWFKRDLRCHDHAALLHALSTGGPVLGLYVYEPELIHAPDCAAQHVGFVNECLRELQQSLAKVGLPLLVRTGRMPHVLAAIHANTPIASLHSHEETGNGLSYARDIAVAAWCRQASVAWTEVPQNAVVRRLKNRDVWSDYWLKRMAPVPLPAPWQLAEYHGIGVRGADLTSSPAQADDGIRSPIELGMTTVDKPLRQRGGRKAGVALLASFLADRALHYRKGMSSPQLGADVCSRLSPHLAFGTLSMREVVHAVWRRRDALLAEPPSVHTAHTTTQMLQALKSFESRLHWHCHFMQKLESQPNFEHQNLHKAANGLRPNPLATPKLHTQHLAWASGHTGVPMVDACMRMLNATGWVNFRMRAMLVAFSSYHLWHHWQPAAQHLAQAFLDYEPGIHYPQIQMQSGTTGINTPRIYNPIKQARDQDPGGQFVRQWCPELARLPTEHIFEPWLAPTSAQTQASCVIDRDYPAPIVNLKTAAAHAKDQIWALRANAVAQLEAKGIYIKHGSRNPNREGRPKPKKPAKPRAIHPETAPNRQASLF